MVKPGDIPVRTESRILLTESGSLETWAQSEHSLTSNLTTEDLKKCYILCKRKPWGVKRWQELLPPLGLHEVSQPTGPEFCPWGEGRAAGAGACAEAATVLGRAAQRAVGATGRAVSTLHSAGTFHILTPFPSTDNSLRRISPFSPGLLAWSVDPDIEWAGKRNDVQGFVTNIYKAGQRRTGLTPTANQARPAPAGPSDRDRFH